MLGATIVNRWFTTNRGLVMGLLTASTATGTLIFTPGLAALVEWGGWKPVVLRVAACCAALIRLVYVLVPERPASIGLRSCGSQHDDHPAPPAQGNPFTAAFSNLARAATTRAFWFLFTTFFICGFTTNGLVGTHLIAFCSDHGIVEVQTSPPFGEQRRRHQRSDGPDGFFRFLSSKCEDRFRMHQISCAMQPRSVGPSLLKKRMSRPSRPSCPKLNNGGLSDSAAGRPNPSETVREIRIGSRPTSDIERRARSFAARARHDFASSDSSAMT